MLKPLLTRPNIAPPAAPAEPGPVAPRAQEPAPRPSPPPRADSFASAPATAKANTAGTPAPLGGLVRVSVGVKLAPDSASKSNDPPTYSGRVDSPLQPAQLDRTPLLAQGMTWHDREQILDRLSQVGARSDGVSTRDNGDRRCVPSSFLGAVIMTDDQPPSGLLSVADELRSRFHGDPAISPKDASFRGRHLAGIQQRLSAGSATYSDIHTLQQYIYDIYGINNDGVVSSSEMIASLANLGRSRADSNGYATLSVPELEETLLNRLPDGEAVVIVVAADQDGRANHGITVGKTQDGRVFLYDPGDVVGDDGEFGHVAFLDREPEVWRAHLERRAVDFKMENSDSGESWTERAIGIPHGGSFGLE